MNMHQKLGLACNILGDMGVEVSSPVFGSDGQLIGVTVNGFSKSGTAKLVTQYIEDENSEQIWVYTRYDEIDRITVYGFTTPEDIVDEISSLALYWWRRSYGHDPQTFQIPEQWKGYWLKKDWIKENVKTVVTYS